MLTHTQCHSSSSLDIECPETTPARIESILVSLSVLARGERSSRVLFALLVRRLLTIDRQSFEGGFEYTKVILPENFGDDDFDGEEA